MLDYYTPAPMLAGVRIAVLPVGATEQHGPHLPVATDMLIAEAIARTLGTRLDGAWVLPCLPFGLSHEHAAFPGCVTLRTPTLCAVVHDVLQALDQAGFTLTVIVNAHGGNHVLRNVVQEWNAAPGRMRVVLGPSRGAWQRARDAAGLTSTLSDDMHAGEAETSILLHIAPEAVHLGEAVDHKTGDRDLLETLGMPHYATSGVAGFPSLASGAKGAALLAALAEQMAAAISEVA